MNLSSNSIFSILILIAITITSPHFSQGQQLHYPPDGYFSTSDVTSMTWAHGVNSQESLMKNLHDKSIQMIEADLCRGRINISGHVGDFDKVIMAHPPVNTSDLSFVDFIDTIINYNRGAPSPTQMKGVKLDFKDYFAAVRAVIILQNRHAKEPLLFPVWLNADVVQGPVDSTSVPKINGVDLLKLHDVSFPTGVLSLGWTTRYGKQSSGQMIDSGEYTRAQVDEMIQVFKNFTGNKEKRENIPVTFAVRAGIAERSLENMLYLLNGTSKRSSLTFWAGANDPPSNLTLWDDFFRVVGKERIFIDVPFDWKKSSGDSLKWNFVLSLISFLFIMVWCGSQKYFY